MLWKSGRFNIARSSVFETKAFLSLKKCDFVTKSFIYNYIRQHTLAVIATVSNEHAPEAAVIGIAVSEQLEIIFDTLRSSRKYQNLSVNPKIALVIGWGNDTMQYEGVARELIGESAGQMKEVYFSVFEEGRAREAASPDITYFKVSPSWIRYSNYESPGSITEMQLA